MVAVDPLALLQILLFMIESFKCNGPPEAHQSVVEQEPESIYSSKGNLIAE